MAVAPLTDFQKTVLFAVQNYCTTNSGFATGGIASLVGRQPGRESNRKHSAYVGETLRTLEVLGYVGRMDAEDPVIWVRRDTPALSQSLQRSVSNVLPPLSLSSIGG